MLSHYYLLAIINLESSKPKSSTCALNLQTEHELTDEHLLKLAERIPNENIRCKLGIALGIPNHQIQSIKSDNKQDITSAAHVMLQTWLLNMEDEYVARKELIKALKKAELKLLINKVLNAK